VGVLMHRGDIRGGIQEGQVSRLVLKLVVSCLSDDLVDSFGVVRWLAFLESGLSW